MSIFRTPQAKEQCIEWHHRFRNRIGRPTEAKHFSTSFGTTHTLLCGRPEAPPLVVLHGALASSAHALAELADLADHFRLIAIDVLGQSPMSAEVRPNVNGNDFGKWMVECLDALGLETTNLLGISWGGFVALRTAAVAPGRIRKLSLIVPAGLVNNFGLAPITKMAIPMMMYRAFPSPKRLEQFTKNLLTTPDPDWIAYLGQAFLGFQLDFRPPRLLGDTELAHFKAPVQVFGAELDLSFPGAALLARAKQVFPNLVHGELLAGNRHAPATDPVSRKRLAETIHGFLKAA